MADDKTYILPVAIGTPIYVLKSCYCHETYANQHCKMLSGKIHGNTTVIAVIRLPDKHKGSYRTRCIKIYKRPFDPVKHLSKWGKSAFATEDEAVEMAKSKK